MPWSPGARAEAKPVLRLVQLAAAIGLLHGIIEGVESFLLSLLPNGLSWYNGNSVDAVLHMPAFYGLAYLGLGLLLVPLAILVRRDWWDIVLLFLLGSLSGYLLALNQGAVFSRWACAALGLGIGSVLARRYRRNLERSRAGVPRLLVLSVVATVLVMGGTTVGRHVAAARQVAALPEIAAERPSVLFIVLDTQRADHLSAYGYHRPTTPRLDALAVRSVLFEQAYAS
jgi:glucan phosphoethanolaminetransferase (alkaline phosphatase superfamily)